MTNQTNSIDNYLFYEEERVVTRILKIHGTSSNITFECEDTQIKASGEFLAQDGKIAGFVVSKASLKYEDGEFLSFDEQEELLRRYEEYANQSHFQENWFLAFE